MTTFEDSLALDTPGIIEDFKQLVTIKSKTVSYDSMGTATTAWTTTVYTAYVDIQPLSKSWGMKSKEVGNIVTTDHVMYCLNNSVGIKMTLLEDYRVYDAIGNEYKIYLVFDYTEHIEVYMIKTTGEKNV